MHALLRICLISFTALSIGGVAQARPSRGGAHLEGLSRGVRGGPTVKTWQANGVKFRHESTPWHGRGTAAWERTATGKDGSTLITGKAWSSPYRGIERTIDGVTHRVLVIDGSDGVRRYEHTETRGDHVTRKQVVNGELRVTLSR